MSDYKKIREATDARLFLRNYIYDEETLPIFESLLKNRFKCESIVYDNMSKMYAITNMDSGVQHTTEQDFGLYCGVPVLRVFCEFLTHPVVVDKINKSDFAISNQYAKLLIRNARYDAITAGVLIDITGISSSDTDGVFSFVIKL